MVWAIAVRNLLQHKTKSLIVGVLITVGLFLTFAGNALIDSLIRNIEGIFTEYYTGDILVTSSETLGAGVFGAQSDDVYGAPVVPLIDEFERVETVVASLPGVKAHTRQLSGYALFSSDTEGVFDFSLFFGVEPESYFSVMSGAELVEGRRLEPGERGLMLSYNQWLKFKEQRDREIRPGDLLQLTNFGTGGFKIQEVPVVGIFRFPRGNERTFPMSFLDTATLRYLIGRQAGRSETVEVAPEATALLSSDLDDLFGDDSFGVEYSTAAGAVTSDNVFDILGGEGAETARAARSAAQNAAAAGSQDWNFLILRLEEGVAAEPLIEQLNKTFEEQGLLARAQGWWVSAMPDSATYSGLQILFNIALVILAFVAVIIIMNTLVVSVMERTAEIGTMRALGARKSFITRLFIAETSALTALFGGLGLLLGAGLILVLNQAGIDTNNDALRYFGGGGVLRPEAGLGPLLSSLGLMALIALLSWVYPVLIALKISPLKAISTE